MRIQVARLRERQVGESLKCFKGDLRGRLKKGNLQQVVGLKGGTFFFLKLILWHRLNWVIGKMPWESGGGRHKH